MTFEMPWSERVRVVARGIEAMTGMSIRNPELVVVNIICNGCGLVSAGTMDSPPEDWHLGRFAEDKDYCPACKEVVA